MSIKSILVDGPVTTDMLVATVKRMNQDPSSGGHSLFLGQVRDDMVNGKTVTAIEYSAYGPMVQAEAGKIKDQIFSQFDDVKEIVILHSTGMVKTGEVSLLVAVSAGHRKQAIEACSHAVELIKEKLPVWKKEVFNDESHLWK
jgi:molybdopterin synthase catalytic subunit